MSDLRARIARENALAWYGWPIGEPLDEGQIAKCYGHADSILALLMADKAAIAAAAQMALLSDLDAELETRGVDAADPGRALIKERLADEYGRAKPSEPVESIRGNLTDALTTILHEALVEYEGRMHGWSDDAIKAATEARPEQRARVLAGRVLSLLPGPVMPVTPPDAALKPIRSWRGGYWTADFLYDAIRDALIAEQKEQR